MCFLAAANNVIPYEANMICYFGFAVVTFDAECFDQSAAKRLITLQARGEGYRRSPRSVAHTRSCKSCTCCSCVCAHDSRPRLLTTGFVARNIRSCLIFAGVSLTHSVILIFSSGGTELAATSRKEFLSSAAAAAAAAASLAFVPTEPAFAAKYGGFGAGSPEVLDPSAAEVDRDILGSEAVQRAIREVQGFQAAVKNMQDALSKDPQANLRPTILKELDFSKLRTSLNAINPALEEDTQRGTDRLIRVILQDITELESANSVKDGVARSERRLGIMQGKLAKLDQAFSDYLAFSK